MKRTLLILTALLVISNLTFAQVYLDQFDDGNLTVVDDGSGQYSYSEMDGELTVTGNGTDGEWSNFRYDLHDENGNITVDATENNKIYVKAKANSIGLPFRMDIVDANGYMTNANGIVKTLLTDYIVLEFDFTGNYADGGFGGPCAPEDAPCPVDGSQVASLVFFIDPGPGTGGFDGSVVIDYISFGQEPEGDIMSDIFQDHFDQDSSLTAFGVVSAGYTMNLVNDTELEVTGDGTVAMWDPFTYDIRNQSTFEATDIDVSGNNKMYIKMKSSVPQTAVRVDLIDIDGYVTRQSVITKIVGPEYSVYEFDYTGIFFDTSDPGSPCTEDTAPCPVNPERIANILFFIEPGVGEFNGVLTIDYISFGISLDPAPPVGNLVYGDHYNNNSTDFVVPPPGFTSTEEGTEWTMVGDGTGGTFAAFAYGLHDQTTGEAIFLDVTENNKLFIKAKASQDFIPLRVDLVDTAGYVTTLPSLTKSLTQEYNVLEFDFTAAYVDAGYGGTSCDPEAGMQCPVDGSAIGTVLLYINPIDGGFDGTVTVDFLSFGAPMTEDAGPTGVADYSDQFDNDDLSSISDATGLVSSITESVWTITGDASSGQWSPLVYDVHDLMTGESIMANAAIEGNKLYIRAKSSVDQTILRIDLQDNEGFVTSNPSVQDTLTTEYTVFEYDYTGTYMDGGFGGTPCTSETAPCQVDAERINALQFFVRPGEGMFDGAIDIDWISFGAPLADPNDPTGVLNYQDEFDNDDLTFLTDNDGLVSSITGGELMVTGDGNSGQYAPVIYDIHDLATAEMILADVVGGNDKIYIRAKSTVDVNLRVDLQDNGGFVTSNPAVERSVGTEYSVIEFDYAGTYTDGGFGGTPCSTGPCDVDGQRVAALQLFLAPGVGAFDGILTIDWISFGSPIVNIVEIPELETLLVRPNPVTDLLVVEYDLVDRAQVSIELFDVVGKKVLTAMNENRLSGNYQDNINTTDLQSGLYFLVMNINGQSVVAQKIIKN